MGFGPKTIMFWALFIAGSLSLHAAVLPAKPAANTAPKSEWQQVAASDNASYDTAAEQQLLDLANSERARLGLSPLKLDQGMVNAARTHAAAMAAQEQISHQFSGEPSLTERIAANSDLRLDREGENVAVASTADDAHRALMASPPHRENLLNANFNVAGIGVYRRNNRIYVAQDFGGSLPSYSVQQAQALVEASVEQLRAQANMPKLERTSSGGATTSACAMAQADSLSAAAPSPGAYMLRYTSMTPETIPSSISKVISQRGLHTYSAGTCYARTQKYPSGAYWVVLVFY